LRKQADGSVFGPFSLDQLAEWASNEERGAFAESEQRSTELGRKYNELMKNAAPASEKIENR